MAGNSTSLYSTASSNGSVNSNNLTTLYPSTGGAIVPTTPYGNANVVALLAEGSDGGNTIGNISATGNITGNYFIGNGSQLTGIVTAPGTEIVNGSSNVVAQFNGNVTVGVAGSSNIAVFAPDGLYVSNAVNAVGNITGNFFIGNGSQLTGLPAGYSNAQVAAYLSSGTVSSNIITSANISGQYILGNGSQLTGLPASYSNANVTSLLASFGSNVISTTGNITGGYILGNGSQLTGIVSDYGNANVAAYLPTYSGDLNPGNVAATGNVSGAFLKTTGATGNIQGANYISGNYFVGATASLSGNVTGAYFLGNGSQLTGLPATYSNANVATFLANFGSNTISTTGNITGGYILGNGSQLTGLPATYSNTNAASFLASFGSNTINTTGNVTTGNLNVQNDAVITGNLTVNGNTIFVNSNVVTINDKFINLANNASTPAQADGGGIGIGPISGEYATLTFNSTANTWNTNLPLVVAGNVTGNYFVGNGSTLTSITGANVTGTVANATYALSANAATYATQANYANIANSVAGANVSGSVAQADYANVANSVAGGNVTGSVAQANYANIANSVSGGNVSGQVGNALVAGTVYTNAQPNITSVGTLSSLSSSGNITASYFIGNGSALTGIVASGNAAGSNTQIQYNDGGVFAGNAAMTFDNTTGNVTMANLIVNTLSAGGATLGGNATRLNTSNAFSGTYANLTGLQSGQMVIGNGYFGNLNLNNTPFNAAKGAKLLVWDSATLTDGSNVGIRYNGFASVPQLIFGNVSNTLTSIRGTQSGLLAGGGASANTVTLVNPYALAGHATTMAMGQPNATVATGNITTNFMSGTVAQSVIYVGSNIGNAVGFGSQINNAGNITNMTGYMPQFTGTAAVTPGNVYGYYMPGATVTSGSFGLSSSNTHRSATNYYFLRNDDAVAQTQLGSLRSYNEYRYSTATSGTFNLDKTNAQVQYIAPTGVVTISGYSNMVTSLSDGVNIDYEIDTLTVIVQQGATPYAVNLPAGSQYVYANGVNTIPAVANSTTVFTVRAYDLSGTATYYTTISSTEPTLSLTGNITGGNILTSGVVSASGNVSGNYFIGNGSLLTGLPATYSNANVTSLLASFGSNVISTSGNITGGNIIGTGTYLTGINAFGNIAVAGQTTVSADNTTDTLTLVAGTNITITTDAANNKVTITSSGGGGGGDTISPLLLMGG